MTPTMGKAARAAVDDLRRQTEPHWRGLSGEIRPDGTIYLEGCINPAALVRAVLLAIREPDDDVLRAYYESQFPPADAPAGGFSRWATWDEARETQGPRIQAGLTAAIDAIIGEETR